MLFHNITNSYIHEDPAFPKDFDLSPCVKTVTAIKLLDHKLVLWFTTARRNNSQESCFQGKQERPKLCPSLRRSSSPCSKSRARFTTICRRWKTGLGTRVRSTSEVRKTVRRRKRRFEIARRDRLTGL